MTDYVNVTNTQVQPKAPGTSELITALRDNPIAITEGSTGAPRIADAVFSGQRSSTDTNSYNIDEEYGGLWVEFIAWTGSGGTDATELEISFSDDDEVSWSSKLSLTGALITGQYRVGTLFIDYTLGAYRLLITGAEGVSSLGLSSGTVGSWPTGAITHVRFSTTITATGKAAFLGRHQGGEAVL